MISERIATNMRGSPRDVSSVCGLSMSKVLSNSIQTHVLDWRARAWPIDWSVEFERAAPLVLEIGFGNGQFLLEQAVEHPENNYVGLELSWSGAIRLLKRLSKAGVTNARALLIDAEVALQYLFETESLDEVFVNHPCPWPKAAHVGRRLLHPRGIAQLADRMRTGAQLTFVTDHAEYAVWVEENLVAQSALVSCHATPVIDSIPGRRATKYESKATAQGVPIRYFQWRKERAPDVRSAPASEATDDMPSITLRSETPITNDAGDLFHGFSNQCLREQHDGVEIAVRLIAAYRRVEDSKSSWLIETLVQEDRLRQDFCILAVLRKSGDILLCLSNLGRPHPTHGVRRALYGLSEWLRRNHPGLTVAHENVGAEALTPLDVAQDDESGPEPQPE